MAILFQVSCFFVGVVAVLLFFCFFFGFAATGAAAFLIASLSVSNENDNVRDLSTSVELVRFCLLHLERRLAV